MFSVTTEHPRCGWKLNLAMPKIKTITGDGGTVRVLTKAGKPSCTCCGLCVCSEELPDTYDIDLDFYPFDSVVGTITVTRESPCVWRWTDESFSDVTLKCTSAGWQVEWESEGVNIMYQVTPNPTDPSGLYIGGEFQSTVS